MIAVRTLLVTNINGGEFLFQKFESYLESKGILHAMVVLYSPEQNGVAVRMNTTLLESASSIMVHSGLLDKL